MMSSAKSLSRENHGHEQNRGGEHCRALGRRRNRHRRGCICLIPAKERLSELVAWHPTLGVAGKHDLENRPREATTQLSLLAPAPHTIRVIDVEASPSKESSWPSASARKIRIGSSAKRSTLLTYERIATG